MSCPTCEADAAMFAAREKVMPDGVVRPVFQDGRIAELERQLASAEHLHKLDHSLANQWQAKNERLETENERLNLLLMGYRGLVARANGLSPDAEAEWLRGRLKAEAKP